MTHRIRVLRTGCVVVVVEIDDYDTACQWAYNTMREHHALDEVGQWAATIETGRLFVDPWSNGKSFFSPSGEPKEGLLIDKSLLQEPGIDMQQLFGLS